MIARLGYRLYLTISALLIVSISLVLTWGMHAGAAKLPLRQYYPMTATNALWDWTNPTVRTPAQLSSLADYLYLHNINAVYVDVSMYADILQTPDPVKRATQQKQLTDGLQRTVTALGKRNIKVLAAAGDTDWSKTEQRHIPVSILQFAQTYNRTHPQAKLAGMQFDIESYNQTGFPTASDTEKELVLDEYLDTVDQLSTLDQAYVHQTSDAFQLGFSIPYWFDNENGNIKSVTWHGKTGPTLYHILDRLNTVPNSNVVVMAYRNAASGNDGVIAHARTEVDYAQANAPHVRIIIGQEVNNVDPAKITYYGQGLTELSSQAKLIYDAFNPSGVMGGIAINDLAGYQKMSD